MFAANGRVKLNTQVDLTLSFFLDGGAYEIPRYEPRAQATSSIFTRSMRSAASAAFVFRLFFSSLHLFQLKEDTEKVREELATLKQGNLSAMQQIKNIQEPWKQKLELTVQRLNDLFSE